MYDDRGKLTELCFFNDKDTEYKTDSIGDLNYLEKYYYFYIIDYLDIVGVLLTEINETTHNTELIVIASQNTINEIWGEIEMLGYIILFIGLLAIGLGVKSVYITFAAYMVGEILGLLYLVTYGSLGTSLDFIKTGLALTLLIICASLHIIMFSPQPTFDN